MEAIALARLVATHGIRGELKALPFTDESEHLFALPRGEVRRDGNSIPVEVASTRPNNRGILIRFEGVESIDAARGFVGGELWGSWEYAAPRGPGEYYIRDLVGMTVLYGGDQVGSVLAVYDSSQAALLEIGTAAGNVLVPFMDEYVGTVDEDNRTVEITKRWILDSE